ncbi:MAG: type II secretion system protein [Bacilli bacterium]|nr:type II secretion system protein [Bacilli bacterium]
MNKKGFTLIELLAVIIILGVVMTIAIPNVLSMLDRNKKETFLEHAKTMANQAEYTLRKDTGIDFPEEREAVLLTLEYLNTDDVSGSPYNTSYSPSKSFVLIVNSTAEGVTEYQYYVHLVACTDLDCDNTADDAVNQNRGINLTKVSELSGSNKWNLVKEGSEVDVDLGSINEENILLQESQLKSMVGVTSIKVFKKLT